MISHHTRVVAVAVVFLGLAVPNLPIYAKKKADIWKAAINGDLKTLQRALAAGVKPDVREPNGSTPLIVTAMFGQADAVHLLIKHRAKLDIQNNDGTIALHVAALFGHPKIVRLLLTKGADSEIRNNDGIIPLGLVSEPWSKNGRLSTGFWLRSFI